VSVRRPASAIRALAVLATVVVAWTPASGEESTEEAEPSATEAKISAEFNDPLTTLPQIFLQDAYTPKNYGTHAATNRLIGRVIVPRVPRFDWFPFVQLVRPSFSLVTVPTGRGSDTRTAFGDIQLFDLAVLPWPRPETGLFMGVGPLLVFPTASDDLAGQNAWQAGPAFAAIYRGTPGLLLGGLVQNPISFAYTESDHEPISNLLFQPIVLAYLGRGFYLKSADSTWTLGWREEAARIVPVSLGLGYVMRRPGCPPMNIFTSGEWTVYRENAPVAPQFTLRLGITAAFPGWEPW
jgi:hypothetical protein